MRFEKVGTSYHLNDCNGLGIVLSPKQAEDLFYSLLTTLPNVPERIKTLWEMRCAITCEVTKWYYFDEPTGTTIVRFTGAVKQGNEILYTGMNSIDMIDAVTNAYTGYGMPVPTGVNGTWTVKTDLVSKKTAEEKLIIYQATKYCEANGITLKQLFAQATTPTSILTK